MFDFISCTKRVSALQGGAARGVGDEAGAREERGGGDHVQLLGRVGPPAQRAHAQGQQRGAAAAALPRPAAARVQRAEDGERRAPDVREGGPHHPAPLHLLRFHRDARARKERPALLV